MGKRKEAEKILAISLRKKGMTYPEINKKVGVSEATLSYWLRDVPVPKKYFIKIEKLRRRACIASGITLKRNWEQKYTEVKNAYSPPYTEPFFLFGLGLYIGEGSRYDRCSVKFTNSNISVINLFKKWIETYFWDKKFLWHAHVHAYCNDNVFDLVRWWSKNTGIDASMFYKTTLEKRLGLKIPRKKLEHGTLVLTLCGSGMWKVAAKINKAIEKLEP